MPLKQPVLTWQPALLADWCEMKALSSPAGSFRLDLLRRLWDVNRQAEHTDTQGFTDPEDDTDHQGAHGADEEAFISSVTTELGERAEALKDSYPFSLSRNNRLTVVGPPGPGGYSYIFCLLLTYSNAKELLNGTWRPDVTNKTRDLLQVSSTLAAAGEIAGCAISFGWPRPNGNPPFLRKLQSVYALFGEGSVVKRPRRGVSPAPKDEEIDIIAWRPRPDRAPGTYYLLGQVASGDNWMGKPIEGKPIEQFHRNWFTQSPASTAKGYIFIPHSVPPVDFEGTRAERINAITVRYGIIIDRLRLPALVELGLQLVADKESNNFTIERAEEIGQISNWVNSQLRLLHAVSN